MTPNHLKLFCFACAGASAAGYLRWRRYLPDWLHIQPVELPGRGSRVSEPFIYDFNLLTQKLTEEISRELTPSYAFFGHSLGGLLAYGCAHRLREIRLRLPVAILAACSAAPSRRDDSHLGNLSRDEDLINGLKNLSGTPPELFEHQELLRIILDTAAADFAVCASFRYECREPLETRFFVFGGRHDGIDEADLAAWQIESSLQMTLEMFDGGHFFIREHERKFLVHLQNKLCSLADRPKPSQPARSCSH